MTTLTEWSTFAQILGSAAGALTGLQFVSMALLADTPIKDGESEASGAFATPTVVHFATALFLAAVLSAPWLGFFAPALLWGATGFFGLVYTVTVVRRMRSQTAYHPVLEDWCFHAIMPVFAYTILAVSAATYRTHPRPALFAIAGAALLLLFIGIHNAWDNATFLVLRRRTQTSQERRASRPAP